MDLLDKDVCMSLLYLKQNIHFVRRLNSYSFLIPSKLYSFKRCVVASGLEAISLINRKCYNSELVALIKSLLRLALWSFASFGLAGLATAQIIASEARMENVLVAPSERIYHVSLPDPFNNLSVSFSQDEEAQLTAIDIHLNEGDAVINVDDELLQGISLIREPSFYFSDVQFAEDNKISDFGFILNYGEVYMGEVGARPGCDRPCMQPQIDAVAFIISTDYTVRKQIFVRN